MRIRVIDYIGNTGGGLRFAVEMLKGFLRSGLDARFELVSHGGALQSYKWLFRKHDIPIEATAIRPANPWRSWYPRLLRLPGGGPLGRSLGLGTEWYHSVPNAALQGCDVAWLPWMHRHRIAATAGENVVASFHDATVLQFEGLVSVAERSQELETVRRWLRSSARIVVSSQSTVAAMGDLFGVPAERLHVVSVSGSHDALPASSSRGQGIWMGRPFLIYPANTNLHKNHEVLLEGVARWGFRHPLVLTGQGTTVADRGRGADLRRHATNLGFRLGESLIGLGYLSDDVYYGVLERAWALVMPSLAEGGGSFPVFEAMQRGIPVVCSDIPVMREQLSWTGGELLWFDPRDPSALAARLRELEQGYPAIRARAVRQVAALRRRSWSDVAVEYWEIFRRTREGARAGMGSARA